MDNGHDLEPFDYPPADPLPVLSLDAVMADRHLLQSGRGLMAHVALTVVPLSLPLLTTGRRVMMSS